MASNSSNNLHLTQLTSLLQNSTLLLHQLPTNNVIDWSSIITADQSNGQEAEEVGGGNNNKLVQSQVDDDDSEGESSDDENMFLGGRYSSSEDDEPSPLSSNTPFATSPNNSSTANDTTNAVFIEDSIEYLNEDESALLKRAKCVHSALLLSLPPQQSPTSAGGRKFVEQLIADILSTNTSLSPSLTSDNSEGYNKLVQTMAYLTSSKILNTNPIRSSISAERWRKICLTNGLLIVQYLICLLNQPSNSDCNSSSSINGDCKESLNGDCNESVNKESNGSALDEWNVVILPLLFGNSSLFLVNDALCDALLSLSSFSSSTSSSDTSSSNTSDDSDEKKRLDKCQATINICQAALQNAISSTSNKEDRELRQTYILVVCQVLICLYDGISSSGDNIGSNKDLLEIVQNGIHSTILSIIRGICYTTTNHDDDTSSQQQLTLEALRPVTGMLLPKLYNPELLFDNVDGSAIELWNEILKLLAPYSEERKCCKNWYVQMYC